MSDDQCTVPISVTVNGKEHAAHVRVDLTLVEFLREDLQLYSCRETCGIGVCGTCTVLLDGSPVSGCLTFAYKADGHELTTSEGLGEGNRLHPVQQALLDEQAFQCSFCTPGFAVSIAAMVAERERSGIQDQDPDLHTHLSGHLCRCGCYLEIIAAAKRVAASGAGNPDGLDT